MRERETATRGAGAVRASFLRSPELRAALAPAVASVGYHAAEPGWLSPGRPRVLTDYDAWYVAAGAGAVRVDGEWIAFAGGDLITLKPGMRYERERAGAADPFRVYFAHFLPFGVPVHPLGPSLAVAWPLKIRLLRPAAAQEVFSKWFEAYVTGPGPDALAVRGLAYLMLDLVLSELGAVVRGGVSRAERALRAAVGFMDEGAAGPVSLGEVARRADVSRGHLCALFRERLGVSPMEYLTGVRIRRAKVLLSRGALVKQAAAGAGFSSQHYFCRVFRRRTGMTPTAFARRHARE